MSTLRKFIAISCCAPVLSAQGVNPLSITQLSPTQFQLSWFANTLRPYQIENSPDLTSWTPLTGYIEGTNAMQGVLVSKSNDKMLFRLKTGSMRAGFDTESLIPEDDHSSDLEPIGFAIKIFPTALNPGLWTDCYVNNNGSLTIGTPAGSYRPKPLQSAIQEIPGVVALIAPFWADVDTRLVQFPEVANGSQVVTYGQGIADGRPAFGVNWKNVGYFEYNADKLNSFQLVLIDRSNDGAPGDFDAEFNYNQILWETGSASGGVDGYGGNVARVGITNGIDRTIELQYSGETIKQLDAIPEGYPNAGEKNHATGIIYRKRNSTIPGRYVFQFRNGNLLDALQVNAGSDIETSNSETTVTVAGTASDPSGGQITTLWTVLENSSAIPVEIANPNQLSTSVSFGSGARVSLELSVNRTADPSVNASDVMTINP